MALDRLTKIDGGGISTTSDYRVGIITASKFVGPIEGNVTGSITATDGTFSGNVTVGGTLTYEDVTNIDSVGLITARSGILLDDSITHIGDTDTKIRFPGNDQISFETGGDQRMIIGVGGDISIEDTIKHLGDTNTKIRFPANDTITAETGGNERARINSSGKLLIGSSTLRNIGGSSASGHIQLEGTTANTSSVALINNQANSNSPVLSFGKTRGTSTGAVTTVADGDILGSIKFCGADGTDIENSTANIQAIVNGTVSGNQIPTDLVFQTSQAGSSGRSERLRILSNGNVGIATDTAPHKLSVKGTISMISGASASGTQIVNLSQDGSNNGYIMVNDSSGTTRARLDSSGVSYVRGGNFGVGTNNPDENLHIQSATTTLKVEGTNTSIGSTVANVEVKAQHYRRAGYSISDENNTEDAFIGRPYGSGSSSSPLVFDIQGSEKVRITSAGSVGIGTNSPYNMPLDVRGQLTGVASFTSHANGSQGADVSITHTKSGITDNDKVGQISFSGGALGNATTYAQIRAIATDISDKKGDIAFYTRNGNNTTGSLIDDERLRITSSGQVRIGSQAGTDTTSHAIQLSGAVNNDSILSLYNPTSNQFEGVRQGFFFKNSNNNATEFARIESTAMDTTAATVKGDLRFYTTNGANSPHMGEKLRIDSSGRVMIGGGSSPAQVGDGRLIVYSTDRLHPAIKCAGMSNNHANGWTLLGDNYQSDESQINLGVSYSSSGLVLSRGVKVSGSQDDVYLSSQDSYATRPCAIKMDYLGAFNFLTTETNATTAVDNAVSLTEVFKIDRVGNMYQKISGRNMYLGASQQLRIGVQSNGDPNIEAVSGNLKIMDSGNTIMQLRDDGFEMKQDIYFGTAGKGIVLGNTSNVHANTLDDYEEGQFTATYSVASGSITTFSNRGEYVKVGRVVHIMFSCSANGSNNPSGQVTITGLPFTVELPNANGPRGGGGVVFAGYHAPPELATCNFSGTTINLRLNDNTLLQANTSGTGFGYNAYQISGFGSYMTTA